jgi:type II secretion system protein H
MKHLQSAPGFTLVELIIVMGLLAIVAALSAPLLSNSLRQRNLEDEATRLLAMTEYARDEAASQGIPMVISFDQRAQVIGVEPKTGYEGDERRIRQFKLGPDIQLAVLDTLSKSRATGEVAEFTPEGVPTSNSAEVLELKDRYNGVVSVSRTADRWGYEIVKVVR